MNRLNNAIAELSNLPQKDKISLKGKFYTQVSTRTDVFRKHFGIDAQIKTEVEFSDLERVVVKATISVYQDGNWREVANGFAEEFRNKGMVNTTSALENCETSAIGRALANLGLSGGEFASAFEMDNAINNKAAAPTLEKKYVLLDTKGAKMSAYDDIGKYIDALRKVAGKPDDANCQKFYEANAKSIKQHRGELEENDQNIEVFSNLIDAYETI
tara:strand:- start:136 stop:780 length:645 start_codon:yes stop_codon:yes gene_type:complete